MEHGATADGLLALNRQTLQKAREWEYLQRFRENFADFPEGEVVSSEHPDFLIKTQSRRIGIELTEYHVQEPDEGWGSPMRAREGNPHSPELQQIMRTKVAKVPSYRQQCREVWLFIFARGFEPSTFGDLGLEVEGYWFESGFDRVLFLHHADGYVVELRVRPVS
jgi:hypothetical protein